MLICPKCGREEFGKATHCRQCGALLPFKTVLDLPRFGTPSSQLCPHCGTQLPPLAGHCSVCGTSLRPPPDEVPTEVGRADPGGDGGTPDDEQPTRAHADDDPTIGRADWSQSSPFAEPPPGPEPRSETAQIRAVFTSLQPDAAPRSFAPASVPAGVRLARSLAEEFVDEEYEVETLPERTARERAMAIVAADAPAAEDPNAETMLARPLEPTLPVPESVVAELRARRTGVTAAATSPPDSPEHRLAAASRAVERSVDRSSPRIAAIRAGSGQAESSPAAPAEHGAVRVALEPPLAQGRQRSPIGHDDQTTVYPAVQKKGTPVAGAAVEDALGRPSVAEQEAAERLAGDAIPNTENEVAGPLPPMGPPSVGPSSLEQVQLVDDSAMTCGACGAAIAAGIRFCGECGRPVAVSRQTRAIPQQRQRDDEDNTAATACRARLVLVRGSGAVGTVWPLGNDVNRAGRVHGSVVIASDPFLSPWHATFFYRDAQLLVRDDNSRNGVFIRLRKPEPLQERDRVCIGRQLLMLLSRASWSPQVAAATDATDTRLLASPRGMEAIYLARIFTSGDTEVYMRHQRTLSLGRSGCDINFAEDDYLSQRHCRVLRSGDYTVIEDLGSRNGTFLAIQGERALENGDELMIGNQVLRAEIL